MKPIRRPAFQRKRYSSSVNTMDLTAQLHGAFRWRLGVMLP